MTSAKVILWGTEIGEVTVEEGGIASFEYNGDFLGSGIELSPITMPLRGQIYRFPELSTESFKGLPGMLADSLPDRFGNALIDAWLASQGRRPGSMDAVERLCYTGTRGMGALEFQPSLKMVQDVQEEIHVEALVKLANEILSERKSLAVKEKDGLEQIIRVGTSAGGARAKAVIAWNEQTGEVRSGQIDAGEGFGYWLIKFDGIENNRDKEDRDPPAYTMIEYAYYLTAVKAGIDMTECRLHEEHGRHHFMTRRFDRNPLTGDKIHMQTLGALAHFDFNVPGAYGYEQAAMVMRRMGLRQDEIEELFRRMVFNIVMRNQDDHVKNISFLMDRKGFWSLAPAYDMTYAYNPTGFWTGSHQMTVQGKRNHITLEDIRSAGTIMNIRTPRQNDIIAQVLSAASCWTDCAEAAGLKKETADRIGRTFVLTEGRVP